MVYPKFPPAWTLKHQISSRITTQNLQYWRSNLTSIKVALKQIYSDNKTFKNLKPLNSKFNSKLSYTELQYEKFPI